LEGNGLGVSVGRGVAVNISVAVSEAACVAVGGGTVFVGTWVAGEVGGIRVGVSVQANELSMPRTKITSLGLINEI
jgi:hypothetical protein